MFTCTQNNIISRTAEIVFMSTAYLVLLMRYCFHGYVDQLFFQPGHCFTLFTYLCLCLSDMCTFTSLPEKKQTTENSKKDQFSQDLCFFPSLSLFHWTDLIYLPIPPPTIPTTGSYHKFWQICLKNFSELAFKRPYKDTKELSRLNNP